nr:acyltransferase family protein [Rufibacter roseolus]
MLAETTAGKPRQRIETEKHLKENFDYFDLLKTIAIYFVVVYHCSTTEIDFLHHASFSTYAYYFLNSVLSTCVPIFFFINGALLLNKPTLNLRRHTFKIIRMVLLVTLWALITLAALMVIRGETLPVKEILKSVWQIKEGWTTHLWFLPALVVIYIFLPLLFTTYKHSPKSIYFFLAFVMLLTFGNTLIGMLLTLASFFSQRFLNRGFDVNYFGEFNPFRGIHGYTMGYFILGGLLFAKREILHRKKYRTLA